MYSITWILHRQLYSVATPNRLTASLLSRLIPRARMWFTAQAGRPQLTY